MFFIKQYALSDCTNWFSNAFKVSLACEAPRAIDAKCN